MKRSWERLIATAVDQMADKVFEAGKMYPKPLWAKVYFPIAAGITLIIFMVGLIAAAISEVGQYLWQRREKISSFFLSEPK